MMRIAPLFSIVLFAACAASAPPAKPIDDLLTVVATGEKDPALAAIKELAPLLQPADLPRIEPLVASDDATICMRALFLLSRTRMEKAGDVLVRHLPKLLDPSRGGVPGVALGALSACQVRAATPGIVEYYDASENPSALRALGSLWDGGPENDGKRLLALLLAHKLTMSPAAFPDSALAMIRIMTPAELKKFLEDQAGEKFGAATLIVGVAALPETGRTRGLSIHAAFLKNPDETLVASILWTSPYPLENADVKRLLDDARPALDGRVCDYAVSRLEGRKELAPVSERDAKVTEWKSR